MKTIIKETVKFIILTLATMASFIGWIGFGLNPIFVDGIDAVVSVIASVCCLVLVIVCQYEVCKSLYFNKKES